MAVRIVLELEVEGDGEVEQSIREHVAWLNDLGQYSAEYQEMVGFLAMMKARQSWRLADQYREYARRRRAWEGS